MANAQHVAGTWNIDPTHTTLSFTARHAMVTKVRGQFNEFEGSITIDGENPNNSSVEVTVHANSIDTNNDMRDGHLRSNDFFDIDTYPTLSFKSTTVEASEEEIVVTGDMTIKGVTKEITITLDWTGPVTDPYGVDRLGFETSFSINRQDYGVSFSAPLEAGGVLVSDKVKIELDIAAVKAA